MQLLQERRPWKCNYYRSSDPGNATTTGGQTLEMQLLQEVRPWKCNYYGTRIMKSV
jgi:hypothetical protein